MSRMCHSLFIKDIHQHTITTTIDRPYYIGFLLLAVIMYTQISIDYECFMHLSFSGHLWILTLSLPCLTTTVDACHKCIPQYHEHWTVLTAKWLKYNVPLYTRIDFPQYRRLPLITQSTWNAFISSVNVCGFMCGSLRGSGIYCSNN